MALSDVTVAVNLVTSAGREPVWFPLFLCAGSSNPQEQAEIPYTECTSLGQLGDLLAGYESEDTKTERKEKLEAAKKSTLYTNVQAMYQQDDHPNRFAVARISKYTLADIQTALKPYLDEGWRHLYIVGGYTPLVLLQVADWIETLEQRKMLFIAAAQTESIKTATDSDSSKTYTLTDYTRTVCVYHPDGTTGASNPVAALLGAVAGKTPGSLNYRNVIVNGVAPVALTEEELKQLHTDGFMTLVERAGDTVTSTGKSASGERYIDTIDIEDYVVQELIYNSQKALNINDVVPYNNDGISILENAAVSVMRDCADKGMIVKTDTNTYDYEVNYPAISMVPEEDIANRVYRLGTVAFTVQGAVDKVEITVDMTL